MGDIQVVHTVAGLAESSGGPSRSVVALVDHLADLPGIQATLMTQRVDGEPIIEPSAGVVDFRVVTQKSPVSAKLAATFARKLDQLLKGNTRCIVHAHGIWNAASFWSGRMAKRYGSRFVLHPRGMLEPWCLGHKALKKKLAMKLYQRRLLEEVDLFVATSEQELESIRALGFRQPVAVIPNGVELQTMKSMEREKPTEHRQALFLSRIHPVKGLMNLVRAWARVDPREWRLKIAGPNEGGYWSQVQREIERLGISDQVSYVGPVEGEAKDRLYRESDLFILPSFSENFGIVVAEALSYGLPVVTTKGTPWSGLVERECGWWVEPTEEGLSEALRNALMLGKEQLEAMGKNAVDYAGNYNWKAIAKQMQETYRWLIDRDDRLGWIY